MPHSALVWISGGFVEQMFHLLHSSDQNTFCFDQQY